VGVNVSDIDTDFDVRIALGELLPELEAVANYQRMVALDGRNAIKVCNGEELTRKIGWVPDVRNPEGAWLQAPLAPHLARRVQVPGWWTHLTAIFALELIQDQNNEIRRTRHLSLGFGLPVAADTADLRPHKDELIARTFPGELVGLWFPDCNGVYTVIRAGDTITVPVPGTDRTESWTPVAVHFYVDHDGNMVRAPLLYGPDGSPLVH
jgi:hypothetical protein